MTETLILPLACDAGQDVHCKADEELTSLVHTWINSRLDFTRNVWLQSPIIEETNYLHGPSDMVDKIVKILTHRVFNYQSKRNLGQIILSVKQNLLRQINSNTAIRFYLLYNGGYRASPMPDHLKLIFEPDQTELMLVYQIALLRKEISTVYKHGIEFVIVINNGVAKWVNDISILDTEGYTLKLRKMINSLGAESCVKVLLQSELVGFNPSFSFEPIQQKSLLSDNEFQIVERFLGRRCSREEAGYFSILYTLAESKWSDDLFQITTASDGLMLRQVAHPDMLSFRPFPGGAIRIQNGTFGFQYHKDCLRPKLITSKSMEKQDYKWANYNFS